VQAGEKISAVMPVREFEEPLHRDGDRAGRGQEDGALAYEPRAGGIIAINLDEGDALIAARITDGDREIFLATAQGKAVRFDEKDIRTMGRVARGVTGIRFKAGDRVVGMEVVDPQSEILTVTEKGYGKRTAIEEYRLQGRGGQDAQSRITERTARWLASSGQGEAE
jgi:DNA gyrase subunit A